MRRLGRSWLAVLNAQVPPTAPANSFCGCFDGDATGGEDHGSITPLRPFARPRNRCFFGLLATPSTIAEFPERRIGGFPCRKSNSRNLVGTEVLGLQVSVGQTSPRAELRPSEESDLSRLRLDEVEDVTALNDRSAGECLLYRMTERRVRSRRPPLGSLPGCRL
jgi:hypothetical protein